MMVESTRIQTAGGTRTLYHIGFRAPIPRMPRHGEPWERPGLGRVDEPIVFLTPNPNKVSRRHNVGGNLYIYDVPQWVIAEAGGVHHYDHAPEVIIPERLWGHVRLKGQVSLREWLDRKHTGDIPGGFPAPKVDPESIPAEYRWMMPHEEGPRPQGYWEDVLRQKKLQKKLQIERVAARYKKKKEVPKADGDGTTTIYEYSDRQVQHRNREKAKQIEKLRHSIGDLRKQVRKDLTSEDAKTRAVALAVGLMDATYERVGNDQSAKDGHFGVTGWLVKHLTFSKGKATIRYVGKSGVKHEKVISTPASVKALKDAVKGKGDNDEIVDCDATAVNEYLKKYDVTAKDIRGYHANNEMQARLKAVRSKGGKIPEDKKEREKKLKEEFKQALDETAEAVGHEPSTLKSQYLVPGLEDEFLKDGKVSQSLNKKGAASEMVLLGGHHLTVHMARTENELAQGLMGRKDPLLDDEGMLFEFPMRAHLEFWMKNTFIPLDMIFIDGSKVVGVVENCTPMTEDARSVDALADRLLEVRGGWARDHGVNIGDCIQKVSRRASGNRVKYPRTPHLPWSPGATSDDRILATTAHFDGKQVVVTEKLDGENCTIGRNYTHARSLDSGPHPSRDWIRALGGRVGPELPDGWRLCGENLFAQHSIAYDELPSYFALFSVWDDTNTCLSWDETETIADMLGLTTVPVLYRGVWDVDKIVAVFDGHSKFSNGPAEGYVVRVAGSFPYSQFANSIAKFVRPHHVQTDVHWMQQSVKPNKVIRRATGLKVWLDDVRPTPPGWVHARWPEDAIRYLKTGRVVAISLDHDLGDDTHGTGYDVVTWIEEQVFLHGFTPPEIMNVHSDNAAGASKMRHGIDQIRRLYERSKTATKTDAEKEEEEAERLVRPSPKDKPPRRDLRRERIKEEDEDTRPAGAENDRDLSLNYKRVAGRWVHRVAKGAHKPGDVYESESGWTGINSKGTPHAFEEKEDAEAYAKGGPDEGGPQKPTKKPDIRDPADEKEFDGSDEWKADHTAATPGGSTIIGTPHAGGGDDEEEFINQHVVPGAVAAAKKALADGKKVVFLAEGQTGGYEGSEQESVAKALKSQFGNKVQQDTWDDPDKVDPFDHSHDPIRLNLNHPAVKQLAQHLNMKPEQVEAGLYAMMAGQGDHILLGDEAEKILVDAGIDPLDQESLYKAAFPGDHGGAPTPFSKVTDAFNRMRQDSLLSKIKAIEADGGVAIVTPGASHAYQLKDVLEHGGPKNTPKENPKKSPKKAPKPKTDDQRESGRRDLVKSIQSISGDDEGVAKALAAFQFMSPDEQDQVVSAYETQKKSLAEDWSANGVTEDLVDAITGAQKTIGRQKSSPEDLGKAIAAMSMTDQVIDPLMVGGQKVNDDEKEEDDLNDRMQDSYDQYLLMTPEMRKAAAIRTAEALEKTPEGTPKHKELLKIAKGLSTAIAHTWDDLDELAGIDLGTRPGSREYSALVQAAKENGGIRPLMEAPDEYGPEMRMAYRNTMDEMDDDQLIEVCGGESGPLGVLYDGIVNSGWPAWAQDMAREMMKDMAIDDLSTRQASDWDNDGSSRGRTKKKKPDSASKPLGTSANLEEMVKKLKDCLDKANSKEDCEKLSKAIRMANLEDILANEGKDAPPGNPVAAQIREALRTGDLSEMEKSYVPQKDPPPELPDNLMHELEEFKRNKPIRGRPLTDAELMAKFKTHASPEMLDRMKGMTPQEFMAMLTAITDEEEGQVGGGTTKTAGYPWKFVSVLQSTAYKKAVNSGGPRYARCHPRMETLGRHQTMARMTKSGALSVSNTLDSVATLFQQDWKTLGVPEKIAKDFAYRCDLLSDRVERTAGVDRKALSELDVVKEPGFDPEDIGMEQSGPLEAVDSDEPFMNGEFTQQENRELRERVQDGDLGMQPVEDPQSPQAGKQAFEKLGRQQLDARLTTCTTQLRKAAAHPHMGALQARLVRLAHAIMDVQMGVAAGTVGAQGAVNTVDAVQQIMPHLASVSRKSAAKVAKMLDLAYRIAKKADDDEDAEEPEESSDDDKKGGKKAGKIPPQFLENAKKKQEEAKDKKDDDKKDDDKDAKKSGKKSSHGFNLFG